MIIRYSKEEESDSMHLKQLKILVDSAIDNLYFEKPENIPVLITLSENSIGARAASTVKYAGLGFDWENNQFRIEPEKPLVTKGNNLSDVKGILCKEYNGRKLYFCPRCQSKITKNDYYCRYCGQKLK